MDVGELAMLLNTMQIEPVTLEQFQRTAATANSMMGKLDQEQQLFLYGLYKQSTSGSNSTPKPESKLTPEYYKWEAWTSFKEFPKEDAAKAYVYLVSQMETDLAGGDGKKDVSGWGTAVSTLINAKHDDALDWQENEKIFESVVNNNLEEVNNCLAQGVNVNSVYQNGMTPLHYASDRGYAGIVEVLLTHGADVNAVDNDNQTPLMYAVMCEYKNIAELLLRNGADIHIRNNDGETVYEFADTPEDIQNLFKQ